MVHFVVVQNFRGSLVQEGKSRENMEEMAKEVIECLKSATFGGQYLTVLRGLQDDQWIFNDEDNIRKFLDLSESNKKTIRIHVFGK